ncbi:hypothetical protein [Lacihabitans sp. CS3-21]|nr:hypothetical protein [Lacihabitans sp. CS3-21]
MNIATMRTFTDIDKMIETLSAETRPFLVVSWRSFTIWTNS